MVGAAAQDGQGELGKEVVERELETMDSDINQIRAIVINDAGEASSSDEEET